MSVKDDPVINFLKLMASKEPGIVKLILFGSRAKDTASERSDYDVAVECPGLSHAQWSGWALEVREKLPSLCGIDLVRLTPALTEEFLERIKSEGKVLYG